MEEGDVYLVVSRWGVLYLALKATPFFFFFQVNLSNSHFTIYNCMGREFLRVIQGVLVILGGRIFLLIFLCSPLLLFFLTTLDVICTCHGKSVRRVF